MATPDNTPEPVAPGGKAEQSSPLTVDFGRQQVSPDEKQQRVAEVFRQVAPRYDLMNDLMSLGSHRLIKRVTVDRSGLRPGNLALDLAGGTGDISALLAKRVGHTGTVYLTDINEAMLSVGRDRMIDAGLNNVVTLCTNAEYLPFTDEQFHCVTIAYGLRNVTFKEKALSEIYRVLKPGGRLLVLEFSQANTPLLKTGYRLFSSLWPAAGAAVVGDAAPYKYLVESIEKHPPQEALALMMRDAGFTDVGFDNFLGGVSALHTGSKTS